MNDSPERESARPADDVAQLLASGADAHAVLDAVLNTFGCVTGTLHRLGQNSETLRLVAQRGVPAELLERIDDIPLGKGIAGAAAARRAPVQLCNLQTDTSGVARPDARRTKVSGSLAVPILDEHGRLHGTLGIGKHEPYEFTEAESLRLSQTAAALITHLARLAESAR